MQPKFALAAACGILAAFVVVSPVALIGLSRQGAWIREAAGAEPAPPSSAASEQSANRPPAATQPRPRETVLGTWFRVHPALDEAIDQKIGQLRDQIRRQRASGKLTAYVSIPLTARGGGHQSTNQAIAAFVKQRLEAKYGPDRFWALAPGQLDSSLSAVGEVKASGGDYMYLWTQVLAGVDGRGADFDMVYFVGPGDMIAYFNLGPGAILNSIDAYVDRRAAGDEAFRDEVAGDPARRRDFIRYYGLRASAGYSSGALDEWNIFRLINARREIGDQVAVFYDGQSVSPAEMNAPARAGYELGSGR